MGKSNFVWGEPSFSQDISNNFSKTHHEEFITRDLTFAEHVQIGFGKKVEIEEERIFVKNDKAYLDSINSDLIAPSDDVVKFSNKFLDYDITKNNSILEEQFFDYPIDKDGFYILPEYEYFSENHYDGHGNYIPDIDYSYFKNEDRFNNFSICPDDDEEICF